MEKDLKLVTHLSECLVVMALTQDVGYIWFALSSAFRDSTTLPFPSPFLPPEDTPTLNNHWVKYVSSPWSGDGNIGLHPSTQVP